MLKKYSSWTSNQSLTSMNTDMTMIKSVTMKGDEQQQRSKNHEEVEGTSHIHVNNDIQSSSISISSSSSTINKQTKVSSVEKSSKDTLTKTKWNPKHKHHRHHHHHNYRQRTKCVGQQQKILSPSKVTIKNSKSIHQDQQLRIIRPKVSNNNNCTNNTNGLTKLSHKTTLIDNQKVPLAVYRDVNIQPSIISKSNSQLVLSDKDKKKKTSRGNIPLKTIENKLVSQRAAPTSEAQVSNYSSMICTQPTPCCVQQTERIYIDDSCCNPSTTITCPSNPCVIQQCDPMVCFPQQQQPQVIVYTDQMPSQNFICTSSPNNIIQQTLPQQYACVDNTPQICICQSLSTNSSPQSFICVPQTPCPTTSSIFIQQPPQMQIISPSQSPAAQCFQICSTTPQALQAPPTIQICTPNVTVNPQVICQRPCDSVALPVQKQQLVCTSTPTITLNRPSCATVCCAPAAPVSQPSCATVCCAPAAPVSQPSCATVCCARAIPIPQSPPGPSMFRQALIQTLSKRTGLPLPVVCTVNAPVAEQPMICTPAQPPMVCTTSPLLTNAPTRSASMPIVPLTPGGLLLPFEPCEPSQGMIRGPLPRSSRYPSTLTNFDDIRQQMHQRAQLLSDFRRLEAEQMALSPTRYRNVRAPSVPRFSSNLPRPISSYSSNLPLPPSTFSSNVPLQPPINIPQTSYARGDISSSSTSTSRSSASSTRQPTFGGSYAQPSFGG
ncbi:unnamed protein product [Rotaria sordida]|uniref:Uncharacterized protein n=1 Tax=Rotaria sordida TaxID=392033 RepID=A0A818W219_9BILA|nr:unnamed protein product [Rotaria sordida]